MGRRYEQFSLEERCTLSGLSQVVKAIQTSSRALRKLLASRIQHFKCLFILVVEPAPVLRRLRIATRSTSSRRSPRNPQPRRRRCLAYRSLERCRHAHGNPRNSPQSRRPHQAMRQEKFLAPHLTQRMRPSIHPSRCARSGPEARCGWVFSAVYRSQVRRLREV